jgi:hypothetical protein
MENIYPSFGTKEVRKDYSERIQKLFNINPDLDWIATPAALSSAIYLKPTEDHEFEGYAYVSKIKVSSDQEKGLLLKITANPQISVTHFRENLEKKGYQHHGAIDKFTLITKSINLNTLIDEVKDIESILTKQ